MCMMIPFVSFIGMVGGQETRISETTISKSNSYDRGLFLDWIYIRYMSNYVGRRKLTGTALEKSEEHVSDLDLHSENQNPTDGSFIMHHKRTATGGIIHTIMGILTIVAFIGNAVFMIYVFWLSK